MITKNNSRAFEQFFKENYQLFYFTAFHLLGDEELSRDMVSECIEQVWRNCRNGSVTEWKAYFYRTIRNRCIDYLRHEAVRQKYVDFYQRVSPESTEENEEEEERISYIYRTMETLPPLCRQVLDLCYFQHKRYSEVAAELGISTSSVKKQIMKALSVMRSGIVKKE